MCMNLGLMAESVHMRGISEVETANGQFGKASG